MMFKRIPVAGVLKLTSNESWNLRSPCVYLVSDGYLYARFYAIDNKKAWYYKAPNGCWGLSSFKTLKQIREFNR